MSERRSHCDDDVITTVMSALPEQAKRVVGANDVFRIIAAVEDWVYDNFQGGEYDDPREFTPEERAIQRVRDVCDLFQRRYDSSIRHPTDIPAVAIVAVRRALDGDT